MSASLFALSGPSQAELTRLAGGFSTLAERQTDLWGMTRRVLPLLHEGPFRLACVATSTAELNAALKRYVDGKKHPHLVAGAVHGGEKPRCLWAFSGYAPHDLNVGHELFRSEPAFRGAMLACDAACKDLGGPSLVERFVTDRRDADARDASVFQPFMFALQVSLAALWRHWGADPDGVVGHSMGEVAAAHASGALGLREALRVILSRSALLQPLRGCGSMATFAMSPSELRERLAHADRNLAVAAHNGRTATVVSGPTVAVQALAEAAKRDGISCHTLADTPGHSPLVEDASRALEASVADIATQPPAVPFYSTVTGGLLDHSLCDAAYWRSNMRRTVLFTEAMEAARRDGFDCVVEIGAQPVLLPLIEADAHADTGGRRPALLPSLRGKRPERHTMLLAAAGIFVQGGSVSLDRLGPT